MKKSSLIGSIAVLATLILPLPLSLLADSHEEEQGPLADVWIMVPKPGMDAQYAEAVAAHMAFRADADDSRDWDAYRVVVGHNLDLIQYRHCCFDWADQDAYLVEEEEKGFNAAWNESVNEYVDHYHHYLERNDWENSHWPDEGTDGPYYGVTSWTSKQGAGPGTNEARKKLSEVALNEGWAEAGHNWFWLSRIGGKPMVMIVSSFENFADMAPPEQSFFEFVTEKLGAEEAGAVFSQFSSGFTSSDYTVWMHDNDLSSPGDDE